MRPTAIPAACTDEQLSADSFNAAAQQLGHGRTGIPRPVSLVWNNLTVEERIPQADSPSNNIISTLNVRRHRRACPRHTVETLSRSHGCVKPGEMLLVLGRPGSGRTALLSALADRNYYHSKFASVTGNVWSGPTHQHVKISQSTPVVLNRGTTHFVPSLETIRQLRTLVKGIDTRPVTTIDQQPLAKFASQIMAIRKDALGEGDKVKLPKDMSRLEIRLLSISSGILTQGSAFLWDDLTEGLDYAGALDCIQIFREMADEIGCPIIITASQISDKSFHLFDNVMILEKGVQVYHGSTRDAPDFLGQMGFEHRPLSNISEFLLSPFSSTGSICSARLTGKSTIEEYLRDEYERSETFHATLSRDNNEPLPQVGEEMQHQQQQQQQQQPPSPSRTEHWPARAFIRTRRLFVVIIAHLYDQYGTGTKQPGSLKKWAVTQLWTLIQALTAGSLFYNIPLDTAGFSKTTGALFFAVLFNGLSTLAEVPACFQEEEHGSSLRTASLQNGHQRGRSSVVLESTVSLAVRTMFSDMLRSAVQVTIFSLAFYFIVGLKATADAFFIFWIILWTLVLSLMAFSRTLALACGAVDTAARVTGVASNFMITYCGYVVSKPQMVPWFSWLFWINPTAWAYDALVSNQYHDLILPCVGLNLVPSGPGYTDSSYQSCIGVAGSKPGETYLNGDAYLASQKYGLSHIWRNVAVMLGAWAFFVLTQVAIVHGKSPSGTLLRPGPYSGVTKGHQKPVELDLEAQANTSDRERTDKSTITPLLVHPCVHPPPPALLIATNCRREVPLLTWKNLVIQGPAGLNGVSGYLKPGSMLAVTGPAGSGKTALLTALSRRMYGRKIQGQILLNGHSLPDHYQRLVGFCPQSNSFPSKMTARELVESSFLLRRSSTQGGDPGLTSEQKIELVDQVIKWMDLDTVASSQYAEGLGLFEAKKTSLAIELVACSGMPLILDELTSDLDGNAAVQMVMMIRQLANSGYAIIMSTRQPSDDTLALFDNVLVMGRGGDQVYCGPVGAAHKTLPDLGVPAPVPESPRRGITDRLLLDIATVDSDCSGSSHHQRDIPLCGDSRNCHDPLKIIIAAMEQRSSHDHHAIVGDPTSYAASLPSRLTARIRQSSLHLFRSPGYIYNKLALHAIMGLFNGFSFWKLGASASDQQLRLSTVFNLIFVATGVVAEVQPFFLQAHKTFEQRDLQSRSYGWLPHLTGLIISEVPYVIVCKILYFFCWYYTTGMPTSPPTRAGGVLFTMLGYGMLHTAMAQLIAACSESLNTALLLNPLILGNFVAFSGILVPYSQMPSFWKYWAYYIDPFTYMVRAMLTFTGWGYDIHCSEQELAHLNPPPGATSCEDYLGPYLSSTEGFEKKLLNPAALKDCQICMFRKRDDWLYNRNIVSYRNNGWRDAGLTWVFAFATFGLTFMVTGIKYWRMGRRVSVPANA